jgi:NAD(P)-dependent dehydrogenase (short-subunit alcohol dehydrogenase family)
MYNDLQGKSIVITSAGAGIGRATALAFGRAGARVMASDLDRERGEATVTAINQAGGQARFHLCDVSVSADVEALMAATVDAYGQLDCAYNNAGIEGPGGLTHLYDETLWHKVIAVNLIGVWLCMKYEIPYMLQQGGGTIVNAGSIAGLVASTGNGSAYTASKHGIIGLTKVAALEYAKSGIRVNAICPGVIQTTMTERMEIRTPGYFERISAVSPTGRVGMPEEVAEAVLWLCSNAASFVTGHALAVDGGYLAQ